MWRQLGPGHPEGHLGQAVFSGGSVPEAGTAQRACVGFTEPGDNQPDNRVFIQLTGIQMHKPISFQKQFAS